MFVSGPITNLIHRRVQSEDKPKPESQDEQMHDEPALPTGPAALSTGNRKRPRLDLATDSRERKRGKTVFGRLLGTLNKAKNEDKERNASEAVRIQGFTARVLCAKTFTSRRRRGSSSNRGYRISLKKRLILSGEQRRQNETRLPQIAKRRICN